MQLERLEKSDGPQCMVEMSELVNFTIGRLLRKEPNAYSNKSILKDPRTC